MTRVNNGEFQVREKNFKKLLGKTVEKYGNAAKRSYHRYCTHVLYRQSRREEKKLVNYKKRKERKMSRIERTLPYSNRHEGRRKIKKRGNR